MDSDVEVARGKIDEAISAQILRDLLNILVLSYKNQSFKQENYKVRLPFWINSSGSSLKDKSVGAKTGGRESIHDRLNSWSQFFILFG